MALDGQVYSFPDWQFGVAIPDTIGDTPDDPVTDATLINIDGPVTFTPGTFQAVDIRSVSSGRVADIDDVLTCAKGVFNEVSFSAIYDTTVGALLLPNVITTAVASSRYIVAYNWNQPELAHGGAAAATKTLDLVLIHPETDKTIVVPSAVLTSLTLSMDHEEENGRVKMNGTFGSGYIPKYDQTDPTGATPYGSTYRYITDMNLTKTFAGASDTVLKSLSITINNPVKYVGFQGSDGDPQAIARGIPEMEVLIDGTVKVDANTASFHKTWSDGTTVANELSNHGTWSSATNFGVKADNCIITNVVETDVGAAYYDVSMKAFASGTDDVISILT